MRTRIDRENAPAASGVSSHEKGVFLFRGTKCNLGGAQSTRVVSASRISFVEQSHSWPNLNFIFWGCSTCCHFNSSNGAALTRCPVPHHSEKKGACPLPARFWKTNCSWSKRGPTKGTWPIESMCWTTFQCLLACASKGTEKIPGSCVTDLSKGVTEANKCNSYI